MLIPTAAGSRSRFRVGKKSGHDESMILRVFLQTLTSDIVENSEK